MKDPRSLLLILLGPLVSIAALPGLMIDTTNLIKLLILGIFAGGLAVSLFTTRTWLRDKRLHFLLVILGIFFLSMLVPLIFSGSPFDLQLYGSHGRNTGFITYLFLILVALSATTNSNEILMARISKGIIVTGAIETFYTFLQYFKVDPINWHNADGWLFGTFINPDFLSAFLGFSCVVIAAFLFEEKTKLRFRLLLASQLIATLFIIVKSKAMQGLAITLVGVLVLILIWFRKRFTSKIMIFGYIFLVAFGSLFSILGFLQRGPLKGLLYQKSITFRGDYWRAGWQMFLHHPLTGVGLDSYGDWYMKYRTLVATRRGPEVTSTAAHNLFLDFAAYGGILLVLAYLLLNIVILISVIRVFRRSQEVGVGFVSISLAWIAYLAQSIISINYIALAVWGWLFAGLIIGYERSTSMPSTSQNVAEALEKNRKGARRGSSMADKRSSHAGPIFVGCIIGAVIALPPFIGDIRWKSALGSGDPVKLIAAVNAWPRNTYRFDTTAKGYETNGEVVQALQLSLSSVAFDARSFDSWNLILNYPNSSVQQKALALSKLKEIDSHYSSR